MKTRMAFGAAFGLIVAIIFVSLQFLVDAAAQQTGSVVPPSAVVDPASAVTDPFESNVLAIVEGSPAVPEPFGGNPAEPLSPRGNNPTASKTAFNLFETDAGREYEDSDRDGYGENHPEQQLQIIRLENIKATQMISSVRDLFRFGTGEPEWFLSAEDQTNSLLLKGTDKQIGQIKRLAAELDRLAVAKVETNHALYSHLIAPVFAEKSDLMNSKQSSWSIRVIQPRFFNPHSFAGIASNFLTSQYGKSQTSVVSHHESNCVIVRGTEEHLAQVERLAEQLDRPAARVDETAMTSSQLDLPHAAAVSLYSTSDPNLTLPSVEYSEQLSERLREQISQLDQESVAIASEVRTLQAQYGKQHPKLVDAHNKLETLLEKSFQAKHQLQGLEVAVIRKRLAQIESQVQQRSQLRQQIIERRLRELLGEQDDLSWNVTKTGSRAASDVSTALAGTPAALSSSRARNQPAGVTDFNTPQDPAVEPATGKFPGTSILQPAGLTPARTVNQPAPVRQPDPAAQPAREPQHSIFEGTTPQQELIMASYAVNVARLKVEQAERRLGRSQKGTDDNEQAAFDRELALLELDRAEKLLEETHRRIDARRESLRIELIHQKNAIAAATRDYEQSLHTNEKVPGSVSDTELRKLRLALEAARLSFEQVSTEMRLFDYQSNENGQPPSKAAGPNQTNQDQTTLPKPGEPLAPRVEEKVAEPMPQTEKRSPSTDLEDVKESDDLSRPTSAPLPIRR